MISRWLKFLRDKSGNVGIIFSLAALPLIAGAGAAIDYSRASDILASLQAGTDATVLVLCKQPATVSTTDLRTRALSSVQSYVANNTIAVDTLTVTSTPRSVTLTTSTVYSTAFMKIMNKNTVPISATAACSASEMYFEIALVLDTTGSMASSGGSQTKMEAAKSAATTFVDYMFSTGALPNHVRMSLVPFAASVAIPTASRSALWVDTLGLSPIHWQYVSGATTALFTNRQAIYAKLDNTESDWVWNGCVESPPYPFNVKDDTISTVLPKGLMVPMFAPDEVGTLTSYQLWGRTYYAADTSNLNSYIDDGSQSGTGTCKDDDSSSSKRFTQACKYNSRNNAQTSKPGPGWGCTSRPLSILGTTQANLKSEISNLQPSGSTNVHEGLMWGWRTISPTSVFSTQTNPPVAYGTQNYQKVIVLMTDGTNTWPANSSTIGKSYYSAYGYFRNADGTDATSSNSRFIPTRTNLQTDEDGRAAIDELLAQACTNAKAKNVVIYTVGFSTSGDPIDAQGLSLLSNCATGPDYAFVANDSDDLIDAFKKISQGIGALRLTR